MKFSTLWALCSIGASSVAVGLLYLGHTSPYLSDLLRYGPTVAELCISAAFLGLAKNTNPREPIFSWSRR